MPDEMTARVAICIPTYNQSAFLAGAVESALAQQGVELEVWVSDDASSDDTPAVMRQFSADARVRYFRQERNRGIAGNNNWLLAQPSTTYIVRLDSDDLLEPAYAFTLAAELDRHPRAGYAHVAVREIDEAGTYRRQRLLARPPGFESAEESLRRMASGYRVAANICMFRREALTQVGWYRPDMNFAEDWDLAVRLADSGWGNVYSPRQLAAYRVWHDAGSGRKRRKLAELNGCRHVFAATLEPAYQRRRWPIEPLLRSRESLAVNHALAIADDCFTATERAELKMALRDLGDGPRLQRRLQLLDFGLGPAIRWRNSAILWARDAVKRVTRF